MNSHRDAQRAALAQSLEIQSLSRHEWRICRAAAPGEQAAILGFIEQLDAHRFEILWMSDPLRWGYAASFDEAFAAVADGMRFTGEVTPERLTVSPEDRPGHRRHRQTWVKPGRHPRVA